jgi:helicase
MPNIKNISHETDNDVLNIVLDTIRLNKQALVFVNTKKSAEKTAEDIAKSIKTESIDLKKLSEEALKALSKPTKQCERLAYCIKRGVAFHHAGLTAKQKELIEDNFRGGRIRAICATPTLAMGVDLPAFRAIIKDLRRYGPRGLTYIPVLEYLQMAGRAGRPKFDKVGEAIIIASTDAEKNKLYEMYICGEPEEIYSKLAVEPVLRTYLLSLIAADFTRSKKEIVSFFSKTFWAFQFRDMEKLEGILMKMVDLLVEWEFIRKSGDDFKRADEIDNFEVRATLIGKRVAELYIDPLSAYFLICCFREASDKKVDDFSFLQMISHTLEMKPLLRVKAKEYEKVQEKLMIESSFLLEKEPSMYETEYEDFLNSVKTAMMFYDWVNEKDEEFLLEEYGIRPGELRAKLDIADWLLYSGGELCKLLNFKSLVKKIIKLRLRMRHGVKEELLPLLRLEHIGRVRARALYRNKIKDIAAIRREKLDVLEQILGKKIALAVKRQVGEEIKEAPERKRRGQISLRDY